MAAKFENNDASVVVVVGSGAGGGTVANELAQKGVKVVCLEAGGEKPTSEIVNDELVMFGKLTWLDKRVGSGNLIPPFPVWSAKGVGGTTLHWTASSYRLQPVEFAAKTHYPIAGTSQIDWPITYKDLEPWYSKAEKRMGVTGTHGNPYLPPNNNYKVMEAGAKRIGLKDVNTGHLAINSTQRDGRPACQQIGFCVSGCAIDAKWTTANAEIPKALETDKFELRAQSPVVRIEHDAAGKATGVVYKDASGVEKRQRARVVILACNAIDSARLLLASSSGKYANGLANGNGQVGRHYMRHTFGGVLARMPGKVNIHRGTHQAGALRDFQKNDPSRGFVGGLSMEIVPFAPQQLVNLAKNMAWGEEYTEHMLHYDHFAGMLLVGEDPSEADNRVTLTDEKDRSGVPVPKIHYKWHANSQRMMDFGFKKGADIYNALKAVKVFPVHGSAIPATHNMGTCRMSAKPEDGVTTKDGATHEIPNLFVCDGGLMTSSGAENPTLTIVALALRQADHIAGKLKRGEL